MNKTEENLKNAFAGESQANRKYLAFGKKADSEGLKQVAKLFRAISEAETIHAHSHLRVLGGIKSTAENLKEAIAGETYEFTEMYPQMIKDAEEESESAAKISFTGANEAEKGHAELYKKALESVDSGKDLEEKDIHVCGICGYTTDGDVPDDCPICKAKKQAFKKIE